MSLKPYSEQVADSYQIAKAASMVGKDMLKPSDKPYRTIDELAYNPVKEKVPAKPAVAEPSNIAKILKYNESVNYKIV